VGGDAKLPRNGGSQSIGKAKSRISPTTYLVRKEGRSYETGEKLLARILKERRAKWEADQLAKMQASGKPPKDEEWKKKYTGPGPAKPTDLPDLLDGW
jgi:type I restriction enzyme S subunit